ncbi:hypothetical protein PIB30_036095 [Stylosanthes scabra]|uniref:Uncharacterized protein n=1 Tax=Stylosanthes scabra TaxID=79078 RepID=A0ABU6TD45_9FABA|nr:hypothetical protein [Stylosanthes scabra]
MAISDPIRVQLGLEGAIAAKLKTEKELLATQDQIDLLKMERDSALAFAPLQEKTSLEQEQKRAEIAEKNAGTLTRFLEEKQTSLDIATTTAEHWCSEWKKLAAETEEMCQETLELHHFRFLNP